MVSLAVLSTSTRDGARDGAIKRSGEERMAGARGRMPVETGQDHRMREARWQTAGGFLEGGVGSLSAAVAAVHRHRRSRLWQRETQCGGGDGDVLAELLVRQ